MSAKVLLTSFKPFDGRKSNVSEETCKALALERSSKVEHLVLDVGPNSEYQLAGALASNPRGVLLTGEDSSLRLHHVRVENRAYNPKHQINLLPEGRVAIRSPWVQTISADFAREARVAVGATGVIEIIDELTTGMFGTFWCNRIYYRALEWGQAQKKPTLFVHVGITGAAESKLAPLRRILDLMIDKTPG